MQWALVAQAEPMLKLRPLISKGVARQADVVLVIVRGTMYGPMRLMPLRAAMSAASTWFAGEPPPEPVMRPVRGWETWSGSRPASAIASFIAT